MRALNQIEVFFLKHWKAISCVFLFPWVVLHFFNHTNWDDYCYLLEASKNSFQQQMAWVGAMNSRYLANFLISYQAKEIVPGWIYGVSSLIFFLAFIGLWAKLVLIYLKPKFPGPFIFISLLLLLRQIYEPAESFFWMPAVYTYLLPTLLIMAYLAFFKDQILESKDLGITFFAITIFLPVVIALCSEQLLLIWAGGLIVLLGRHFLIHRKVRVEILISLLVSFGFIFYVATQSGNLSRSSVSSESFQVLPSILKSIRDFFLIQLKVLELGNVLIIAVLSTLLSREGGVVKLGRFDLISLLVLWFGTTIAGSLLNYLAFGGDGIVSRSLNIGFIISVFFVLFFVQMIFQKLAGSFHSWLTIHLTSNFPFRAVVVLLFLFSLFSNNIGSSFKEAFVVGPRYSQDIRERFRLIENNQGSDLTVPAAEPIPELVIYSDLDPDSKHASNVCFSAMVGLKSLRVDK